MEPIHPHVIHFISLFQPSFKHNLTISFVTRFAVLLPFGDRLLKYLKDPFNFEKLGAIAANIIAERTKADGNSKVHVSA